MAFVIPYNRTHAVGTESARIAEALTSGHWSGDGPFTKRCETDLALMTGSDRALLTHSCTAALEMAALLLDLQPGDEVIMPSFTFVTTASAFALRGAVPVFVDIRDDSYMLDERLIERSITPRTRAIVPVHYAGMVGAMDRIMAIANAHGLAVIEDAAQALGTRFHGKAAGAIGVMGTLSFHATKNIVAGEGGALLVNDADLCLQAEIVREKGTDRSRFLRGQVDKYSWRALGSSFLPAEMVAAFLSAQLEKADAINVRRLEIWNFYHQALQKWSVQERLRLPVVPEGCAHNAHIFAIVLPGHVNRTHLIDAMAAKGVQAVSHYEPLHLSEAGLRFGRFDGSLPVTEQVSAQLLRLPIWPDMTLDQQSMVVDCLTSELDRQFG